MRISDWSSDVCSSDLRLGDEIERARLEAFDRGFGIAVGGDYRHWRLWKPRLDIADQFDAIAIRQAHIGDAQIEALLRQQCTSLMQGANRDGREIHAAEQIGRASCRERVGTYV